jgi:hypothetical protein
MLRRFGVAAALVVGLATLTAPIATATRPIQGSANETGGPVAITNVCPITFNVSYTLAIRYTIEIHPDGTALEEDHWTEADTFSNPSNGTTLTGDPYTGNYHFTYDSSGNATSWVVTGGIEQVTLPDGTVFRTTGRTNILTDPADWVLTADSGHSGDLTAFCTALATP